MTIGKLRFCIVNHWDTGALAASSSAANLPIGNTRLTARGSPWRSTAASAQNVTNVQTGNLAANFVAIFGHNLAGGTIRTRLYSDAAMTTTVYDSTALAAPSAAGTKAGMNYGLGGNAATAQAADDLYGNMQAYVLYFAAIAFRASRFDFTAGAGATAAGYLQTGHTWLGMYHEAERSAASGALFGRGSNTQWSRTRGGSRRSNPGATWRHYELSLEGMRSDRALWDDVLQRAELSGPVFLSVFAGDSDARLERDGCIDGALATLNPLIHNISYVNEHVVVEEL